MSIAHRDAGLPVPTTTQMRPAGEATLLGAALERCFPVDHVRCFSELVAALDHTDSATVAYAHRTGRDRN